MGTDGGAGTGTAGGRPTDVAVLAIEGMHCPSCAALIEETLVEDLGVARAAVDLDAARATVRYDPAVHRLDDLCAAVTAAGYPATPVRS
ncbi:MAG: heavy-metal-associated domain-containing protein [Acidimicrobiales bacterium]